MAIKRENVIHLFKIQTNNHYHHHHQQQQQHEQSICILIQFVWNVVVIIIVVVVVNFTFILSLLLYPWWWCISSERNWYICLGDLYGKKKLNKIKNIWKYETFSKCLSFQIWDILYHNHYTHTHIWNISLLTGFFFEMKFHT